MLPFNIDNIYRSLLASCKVKAGSIHRLKTDGEMNFSLNYNSKLNMKVE
jgi:hypothetical protein